MEPSPAQSLNVTSYSTPTRAVVGDLVETPSPRSPTLSEDSGYDQENSSTSQHSEGEFFYFHIWFYDCIAASKFDL